MMLVGEAGLAFVGGICRGLRFRDATLGSLEVVEGAALAFVGPIESIVVLLRRLPM